MNNIQTPVLRVVGVKRHFGSGHTALQVLKGADLDVNGGEIVALVGPSGSGKSTLLQIAGLLEQPDAGEIHIAGQACSKLNDDRRTAMRRQHLGFVFQYHHLLPEFSALENITIPQIIAGVGKRAAGMRAAQLLDQLGLSDRASHRPAKLSGGEQQRVAIARALANAPTVLLADEPTGNLDPDTANQVFNMLLNLTRETGLTALIATHNPALAARMDRTVRVEDGHLIEGLRTRLDEM